MNDLLRLAADNEFVEAHHEDAWRFLEFVKAGMLSRCDNRDDRARYQITLEGLDALSTRTKT